MEVDVTLDRLYYSSLSTVWQEHCSHRSLPGQEDGSLNPVTHCRLGSAGSASAAKRGNYREAVAPDATPTSVVGERRSDSLTAGAGKATEHLLQEDTVVSSSPTPLTSDSAEEQPL